MHFVTVRQFVVVIAHSVVDGRLRFLNCFSGFVNRDLVHLGRLRVLGQIQFLDSVLHLHDISDDLATCIGALAVTQDQLLDILIHQIQRLDHFERVIGVLLGILLRNLFRDLLRDFLWDFLLVPERVLVAKLRRSFVDQPAPLPCKCSTKCLSVVVESLSSVVLLGYPRPSLAGNGVPWVLTRTDRRGLMPRVASRQSANPLWLVLS